MDQLSPHAVCVPYPSQGHVNPMMQLAKLLHSQGFHITFVNTEFNHNRLVRSNGAASVRGLPSFRFETIPDGLPPSDQDATQDVPALCDSTWKTCLGPFLELVGRLNGSPDVPPVRVVVADGVMGFGMKAADMLGIPGVRFWTASACGMLGYLNYSELKSNGVCPFIGGRGDSGNASNVRLRDLPSFVRTTDPDDIMFNFMGSEAESCFQASSIIFNTFDELEREVLDEIKKRHPHVYAIGPLSLLGRRHVEELEFKSFNSSLWKEDVTCLAWLSRWEPDSVVYVNYGSITTMTSQQFKEFAWGLANSEHPFLWILRPDVLSGSSITLPSGFFEEVRGRGLITSWCPQENVLRHPWQTNCHYSRTIWDMGVEVGQHVERGNIEKLVREMMGGETGKMLRHNAKIWRNKANKATSLGGFSYTNFERFVKEKIKS
uniref:Glycosyltransferase N-terminal domain-containing protein n=1 Tax=Kalanchoe fedtschenkoi TaxID=63787 RepID=A0A7N0T6W9_KALFE